LQHMSVVVYRMKQIHKISLKYVPNDWSSPPRTAKTANNGLAVNVRLTVGLNRSKSKIIPMDLVAPVIVASRVGSTISWYTTGRVGSPTRRVGSGPEKSDPWSTLGCERERSGELTC